MSNWPILSVITFLPLLGVVLLLGLARGDEETAKSQSRFIALWTTIATFVISLFTLGSFDSSNTSFQFVETHAWLGDTIA